MSSVSRLTLFALITAFEDDLRNEIRSTLLPQRGIEELVGPEIYSKCLDRYNRDFDATQASSEAQLINYLDYAESVQILNKNKSLLSNLYSNHLTSVTQQLDSITPVRNRVMHTRPLLFDDLAKTLNVAALVRNKMPEFWKQTEKALKRLEDNPSYVLGLSIPPTDPEDSGVSHNLPLPDFDETGFLGRKQQVDELIKACNGPFPVITIVGEGGIGKTALALRVVYEIVDQKQSPFDYVVWTSSKTTKMTAQEIVRIEGAIESSLGLIQSVANELGAKGDVFDETSEILTYLSEFRILLILDNLETVLDDRVRHFLQNLPSGSKVLITSRIGLGALEYRIQLHEMKTDESVQLLRALATARNVEQLVKVPNRRLETYCERMKNNPGFIKWFISAVQAGKRPEEVLAKPDMFLDFCMANVYDYLSQTSRRILKSMQTIPGELSQAELAFLSSIDDLELQKGLQELMTTNMVNMVSVPVGSTYQSSYGVSDLARVYLAKNHPPSTEESKEITKLKNQLNSINEDLKREGQQNPYSFYSIHRTSKSELIVAKYLIDALNFSRRKEFDEAHKSIETAKRLSPEYYEVHRVEAILFDAVGNITAARNSYEAAIELEPNSAPLRLWFAQFLFRQLQDFDEARRQLVIAESLEPNRFMITLETARISLVLKDFPIVDELVTKLQAFESTLLTVDRRKYVDFMLRYLKDKAEESCDNSDGNSALEFLRRMCKTYIDCPRNLHDQKMREKLKRALPTVVECKKLLRKDGHVHPDINSMLEWIGKITGDRVASSQLDTISGIYSKQERYLEGYVNKTLTGFGFIRADNGKEYFFHFSEASRSTSKEGKKVRFQIGIDPKGRPCAVNIRPISR